MYGKLQRTAIANRYIISAFMNTVCYLLVIQQTEMTEAQSVRELCRANSDPQHTTGL
ncbi:hypothetical protein BT63DRAFT_428248 [Microthyrium microscopicum]|uniref:Uncharacterized protein n=1 Tax=Microthyrium microscopicum TaxID=703497 RepID=A0A6A6TYX7_9PEZI|nr:hypothetical protein BT63DRAFT_428248 [Microthyrium microscopicum]